jgi:hypothetical protein
MNDSRDFAKLRDGDRLLNLLTFNLQEFTPLGPVVQRWISANPGLKFNLLF